MRQYLLLVLLSLSTAILYAQTNIGTTTYDVQTNNGHKHRVLVYPDGTVSAIWTGSTAADASFGDRGMFYQHYDGTEWLPTPTARAESVRTGFGEIQKVDDHEVILSHDAAANRIQLFANDAPGGTTWTELDGSDDIRGIWAVTYCPEGTDDIYVVNADTQFITGINFSRSDDGGASWSVLNYNLPYLGMADGFPAISNGAESYQVAVYGSDVYVLFGMINSDLVLLHSDDYGNADTWESTPIIDFPFDNYTGTVQSDIDGDAITDTINTTDGYHNMFVDDDGIVHVFSPLYRIYSNEGAFAWTVNWNTMGMWHWKSGMAAAEIIDIEIDWVNDDCIPDPYAGIGANTFNYRSAAPATSPGAAWDPVSGRIYLLYTMKIEYTDEAGDPDDPNAQSFHDIFGMYSTDDGDTWSLPVNLTNTAELGEENFYLFVNDRVYDGFIHAVWQQDNEPGHFNEGDPLVTNNILYAAWDGEAFGTTSPNALFTSVADLDEVSFTNLSTDAWGCYAWDFGDGLTSTEVNPVHTYASAGTYLVCLTASNPYGTDEYCGAVSVVMAPQALFSYDGDPVVSFTDLSLNSPTSWSWNFGDGGSSTLQNPDHTYTVEGTYTVCLTATNGIGFDIYCLPVQIDSIELLSPVADFAYSPAGLTVTFTDLSTNSPDEWAWDFGDTYTSTVQNPSHTYAAYGSYNVCLTASNVYGSNMTCKTVEWTGIEENVFETILLYPNPAGDYTTVVVGSDIDGVELFNLMGQKLNIEYSFDAGNNLIIHTADLAAGNYFVRINTNEISMIGSFIKE